ncbi:PREDICTED: uncharacterized protein LOC104588669 isoform X2 [Nelumbo nucifera]|uniref:Uncharacterized protein LOC104588669 isoform X2 n=1 Tax=Nelumbo nucifera TaxID=4432 RepID=A0A1U7ZCH1_NELNU|nr:PREDICTED: uncharacterized protein LOC104588669 isoform X2 [Nelumbo nucifera]
MQRGRKMEVGLSLIEIGGEDDSLLQPSVNDKNDDKHCSDVGIVDFSCSPLMPFGSKRSANHSRIPSTGVLEVNEDREEPCRSSSEDIGNKENLHGNSSGAPNLTEEPQQMKRRKKGGMYNLRKSLAWNAAFFTEEGVLDPVELSMLSGSYCKNSLEPLSSVPEETRTSLSDCSDLGGDASDLQDLEENLFKKSPSKHPQEYQKLSGGLLPKSKTSENEHSFPLPSASRKTKIPKGLNGSVSRVGGCPRPSVSSQKKLPNRNTTTKESKLPKFHNPKPDSAAVSTSSKNANLCIKRSKCNQNGTPAVNAERNAGSKSSSNHIKNASTSASSSLKSSVQCSGKNSINSLSKAHLPTNPLPPPVSKGSSTSIKVTAEPALPAAGMHTPSGDADPSKPSVSLPPPVSKGSSTSIKVTAEPALRAADLHTPSGDADSSKPSPSLQQNALCISGSIQHAKLQPAKPSGLRMPSPSLGFFGQPKVSTFHTVQSPRNAQPCGLPDFNITNLRKFSNSEHTSGLHPLQEPWRPPKLGTYCALTDTTEALSRTFCSSISSSMIASTHPNAESKFELTNSRKMKAEVPSNYSFQYQINRLQPQSCRVIDNVDEHSRKQACLPRSKPDEVVHSPCKDNQRLQKDNKTFMHPGSLGQSLKDNDLENTIAISPKSNNSSGSVLETSHIPRMSSALVVEEGDTAIDNMVEELAEDTELGSKDFTQLIPDPDFASETKLGDAMENCKSGASMVHSDNLLMGHDVNEESTERVEMIHPGPDEATGVFNYNKQGSQMSDSNLLEEGSYFNENQEDNECGHVTAVNLQIIDASGNEFQGLNVPSQLSYPLQLDEGTAGSDKLIKNTNEVDTGSGSNLIVQNHDIFHELQFRHATDGCNLDTPLVHGNCLTENTQFTCSTSDAQSMDVVAEVSSVQTMSNRDSPLGRVENGIESRCQHKTSDGKPCCEIENSMLTSKVKDAMMPPNKTMEELKEDSLTLKYQMNAVPFSDEWLAAIEAAGEDILTRKGGAVQNSPPEKPLLEPNPWSPVKRKSNQEIGPFDCTKYTNQ